MGKRAGDEIKRFFMTKMIRAEEDVGNFLEVTVSYYDNFFKIPIYMNDDEAERLQRGGLDKEAREKISKTITEHIESVLNKGKQKRRDNLKPVDEDAVRIHEIKWHEKATFLERTKI